MKIGKLIEATYVRQTGWLRNHMKNRDIDLWQFWGLFEEWFSDNEDDYTPEIIQQVQQAAADYDSGEAFDHMPPNVVVDFTAWVKDYGVEQMMRNDPSEAPTWAHADYENTLPGTTWLVHFTNNAADILRDGFRVGISDPRRLGLTTYTSNSSWEKKDGGYNFAFVAGSGEDEVAADSGKYGRDVIMFQHGGVLIHHYADEEDQVVFYGPSVDPRTLILLTRSDNGSEEWTVNANPYSPRGRVARDPFTGSYNDCLKWVQTNYRQYKNILYGTKAWKMANEGFDHSHFGGWVNPETGEYHKLEPFEIHRNAAANLVGDDVKGDPMEAAFKQGWVRVGVDAHEFYNGRIMAFAHGETEKQALAAARWLRSVESSPWEILRLQWSAPKPGVRELMGIQIDTFLKSGHQPRQFVGEKVVTLPSNDRYRMTKGMGEEVEVLETPTPSELIGFLNRKGSLRGIVTEDNRSFWCSSNDIIHDDIWALLIHYQMIPRTDYNGTRVWLAYRPGTMEHVTDRVGGLYIGVSDPSDKFNTSLEMIYTKHPGFQQFIERAGKLVQTIKDRSVVEAVLDEIQCG